MKGLIFPLISIACAACSPTVDVTETLSQADAQRVGGGKLAPSAVVHGDGSRMPLSSDATIANGKVTIPNAHGITVVTLGPNDVIEVDADDRITSVRLANGQHIVFAPGSAYSPEGANEVRGRLAEGVRTVDLAPTDKVEMTGTLAEGDRVQGIGHVETSRFTFALVVGSVVTLLAYAPTAYVGASSTKNTDRILLLPVLGPWIDLATRGGCTTPPQVATDQDIPTDPCIAETANKVGLVTSGVAQAVGGILFLVGLPEHAELVSDRPSQTGRARSPFSLSIAPLDVPRGSGLAAGGRF